jgi:hypothetical protein
MRDSDLSGVTMTLVALVLLACIVGAWVIGPWFGLAVSIGAGAIGLYLGYRWLQAQETDA